MNSGVTQPTQKVVRRRRGSALVMTVDEVAEKLGQDRQSVYRAVQKGHLPSVRCGGRIWIVRSRFNEMFGVVDDPNGAAS